MALYYFNVNSKSRFDLFVSCLFVDSNEIKKLFSETVG